MKHQLNIIVGNGPVKQVHVEIGSGPKHSGWSDSIRGNVLGFKKKDWLDFFEGSADGTAVRQDVMVVFKAKRYKLSRLDSDGTFELTKDW